MPTKTPSLSKLAAPIGAVGALAVAVGVWLVPTSALDPAPPLPPTPKPMPGKPTVQYRPPTPPVIDWPGMERHLDLLRTIDPTVAEGETNAPLLTPDRPEETAPPPPQVLASWQYEGYVIEGGRYVALVRMAGTQRFVFPDQEVTDPSIPGNGVAKIKSIDPERLLVEVSGREFEVKRAEPVETNALMLDPLQQAGRVN